MIIWTPAVWQQFIKVIDPNVNEISLGKLAKDLTRTGRYAIICTADPQEMDFPPDGRATTNISALERHARDLRDRDDRSR
jgi:hypothetical protein